MRADCGSWGTTDVFPRRGERCRRLPLEPCYTVNVNWQSESADPIEGVAYPPSPGVGIAELVEQTGLSARTLRYYEELGLLPGVRRRAGGRRVYGADEIERLGFIQRLKALGLSLGEIKDLNAVHAINGSTAAMLDRLGSLLDLHLDELDGRIGALNGLRAEMSRYREHVSRRAESLTGPQAEPEATTSKADGEET